MSYDFGVTGNCDCCVPLNMTYNMSQFMYDFVDEERGIRVFNGKKGWECIPILERFFERCQMTEELAEKYDSPNGWGTVETCINSLALLTVQCARHPYEDIFSQ